MLSTIRIANFRSFGGSFQVELGAFNVFIGANGVGKSNFVESFKFLRESLDQGITTAVARRQGWAGIRCQKLRRQELSFEIKGRVGIPDIVVPGPTRRFPTNGEFSYEVTLEHSPDTDEVVIKQENGQICGGAKNAKLISGFKRDRDQWEVMEGTIEERWAKGQPHKIEAENRSRLFLAGSRFFTLASVLISEEINGWRVYNPDLDAARAPRLAQEVDSLSETADNLALVLHQITPRQGNGRQSGGAEETRDKVRGIMEALVPGFERWSTSTLADGRISFKVKEKPLRDMLPPSLLSDGTVRLLSLLAALLYSRQRRPSTIFIEEPERNLHPLVMQQIVELMRSVAGDTQIVVTTHSPDFVRYCRPEEVCLMDKVDGITQVIKPTDTGQIGEFLNHFTLDQLWLMGYLEKGLSS